MQFSKECLQTVLPDYKIQDQTEAFTLDALDQTTKQCMADSKLVIFVRRTVQNVHIFKTLKDASDCDCLVFHLDDYFSVAKDVDPGDFRRGLQNFVEQAFDSSCMVCHEELSDLTVDKEMCPQCGNHICHICLITLLQNNLKNPCCRRDEFSQSCPLCRKEHAFVGSMKVEAKPR